MEQYEKFLNYFGPKKAMYEKMCKLPKRGKNSLKEILPHAKASDRRHMVQTMKLINNGNIKVPQEFKKRMTHDDITNFRRAKNRRECMKFLKEDKTAARAAKHLADIVNTVVDAGERARGLTKLAEEQKVEKSSTEAREKCQEAQATLSSAEEAGMGNESM